MYIGIDIGGTAAKIGLINNGKVIHKTEVSVSFDGYNTPIIETVKANLHDFLEKYDLNINHIKGIGVSATGQIDSMSGEVIGTGGNIRNWQGTNIKAELENEFATEVKVLNDANCMILAEHKYGKARGYNHALGITIGTGIGGGIIVNDQLLEGSKGIAGEVGHMSISKEKNCTCGNVGCYEQLASMTALIKKVEEIYKLNNVEYEKKDLNGRFIFKQAKENNSLILSCIDEWIFDISIGIANLVHIFNPSIVLIGGGVSDQKEYFMKPLVENINNLIMPVFRDKLKIESASFKNDAGMIGAVASFEGVIG